MQQTVLTAVLVFSCRLLCGWPIQSILSTYFKLKRSWWDKEYVKGQKTNKVHITEDKSGFTKRN